MAAGLPITALRVAQQALSFAGQHTQIASLEADSDTREERLAAMHFEQVLLSMLQRLEWRWATRIVSLSRATFDFGSDFASSPTTPVPGQPPRNQPAVVVFSRPRTWLRVWAAYTPRGQRLLPFDEMTDSFEQRYVLVRQRDLPPNDGDVDVRAVVVDSQSATVNEPTYWSPTFRDAFLYELATRIARSMNKDETLVQSLDQKANVAWGIAVESNEREGMGDVARLVATAGALTPQSLVVKQALSVLNVPVYTSAHGVEAAYFQCYDLLHSAWQRVQSVARPANQQAVVELELKPTNQARTPGQLTTWALPDAPSIQTPMTPAPRQPAAPAVHQGNTDLVMNLWWEQDGVPLGIPADFRETGGVYRVQELGLPFKLMARVLKDAPSVPDNNEAIEACAYALATLVAGSIGVEPKMQAYIHEMYGRKLAHYIAIHANVEGARQDALPQRVSWLRAR